MPGKGNSLRRLHVEHENIQSALCRDGRIELAQRTRRGVAGIGKQRFLVFLALPVQGFKAVVRHIDFTADFQIRNIVARQDAGNGLDRPEIFRNILTDKAIPARGTAYKAAVPVFQRNRQTVDLAFHGIFRRITECFLGAGKERAEFLIRKHVGQTAHLHGMCDLFKFFGCATADPSSRTVGGIEGGIFLLQGDKLIK